jgi:hypothetical protein
MPDSPHENLSARDAYELGADYVACNELGAPLDPARLRRVWYGLMREARVPKVKPYTASRHAAASYLINVVNRARVSPAIIPALLGHADAAFHDADVSARAARGSRRVRTLGCLNGPDE